MTNPEEWIDGFLFVGNQRALDLLNTRLINADGPVELLTDVNALERWLVAAKVLGESEMKSANRVWRNSQAMQTFQRDLLVFRESLRVAVIGWQAHGSVDKRFLADLNRKLLEFPTRYVLKSEGQGVQRNVFCKPENPEDLWSAIAEAAAVLFTDVPAARIRQCQGCVAMFYDTSKKGSRRWCSMNMCGNRDKVATYRHKRRVSR